MSPALRLLVLSALALGLPLASSGCQSPDYGGDTRLVRFEIVEQHPNARSLEGAPAEDMILVPGGAGLATVADAETWIVYWRRWVDAERVNGRARLNRIRRARAEGEPVPEEQVRELVEALDAAAELRFEGPRGEAEISKTQYVLVLRCGDGWRAHMFDVLDTNLVQVGLPR